MNEMNITSAKYIAPIIGEPNTILAVIDGNNTSVPLDPANRHYIEIMRQVDAGTLTIEDA
mgnify:CR=1 FL=1|jgi:hypothetical protein